MQSRLEQHLSRLPWYHAALAALVYATTIAPTISHTDSGELAAVAYSGGIAHPTGYPLFTLLGWIWTRIPIGNVALMLNILCLLFVVGGVYFFSKSIGKLFASWRVRIKGLPNDGQDRVMIGQILAQTGGTLFLAFSHTVWMQSTSIEVYSLHMLLLCLNLYLLVSAHLSPQGSLKPWLWLAGGLALGFSNHLSFFAILAPTAFFFFRHQGFKKEAFLNLGKMLAIFIPLLTILYLYLPLRAGGSPALNWGDPSNGDQFWYHVSGRQFRVWMFTGLDAFLEDFKQFFIQLPGEFFFSLFLILPGLWYAIKKKRPFLHAIGSMMLVNLLYACNYHIKDPEPYFIPTFMVLAIWMAMGIRFLWVHAQIPKAFRPGLALILGLFLILQVGLNHGRVNQQDQWQYEDYARVALNSLPPNAVVISKSWDFFVAPAYYLQYVEGLRQDVTIVEYQMLHDRHWYPKHIQTNDPALATALEPELTLWDEAVDEFDLGGVLNPVKLGSNFTALFNAMFNKLGQRPIMIGPEIFPQAFASDGIRLPDQLTLYPSNYFFKVIPANSISTYFPLVEESNGIRMPKRPYEPETENLVQVWGDILAQRAIYELLFDNKDAARQLVGKVKELDPKRQLPQTLLGL